MLLVVYYFQKYHQNMKQFILFSIILLSLTELHSQDQTDHLSLIYDFEGEDFDYSVEGMFGTNDSLYIISQTPNGQGVFFRIDENGEGYVAIWEFDATTYHPHSLIGNDTIIYGTTRFSKNNGGSIFQYSLQNYNFEFIKDFSPEEAQEVRIHYATDSVLWLSSQWSFNDNGSIATINKDGTGFSKIYNDTDQDKGQNPVDFVFHNDSIYIACFNGGGIPYLDGTGSKSSSGSFIRIKSDGTGYQNIIKGGDDKGTQPQSLFIREDKIIGQFAYSGSTAATGGQFFRSNLDGTEYDSLGGLRDRALTKMLSTDSLIFGVSSTQIFGISPFDGEIRIFDDLLDSQTLSNSQFGSDVVANPAYLNGDTFFATQQGGPEKGGTILRWTNKEPEIEGAARITQSMNPLILNDFFTDPEGDEITFSFNYDEELIEITGGNGVIRIEPVTDEVTQTELEITAYDGWAGYSSKVLTIQLDGENSILLDAEDPNKISLYPNPTTGIIRIPSGVKNMKIFNLGGKLVYENDHPETIIDISFLPKGIYTAKYLFGQKSISSKLIKE